MRDTFPYFGLYLRSIKVRLCCAASCSELGRRTGAQAAAWTWPPLHVHNGILHYSARDRLPLCARNFIPFHISQQLSRRLAGMVVCTCAFSALLRKYALVQLYWITDVRTVALIFLILLSSRKKSYGLFNNLWNYHYSCECSQLTMLIKSHD